MFLPLSLNTPFLHSLPSRNKQNAPPPTPCRSPGWGQRGRGGSCSAGTRGLAFAGLRPVLCAPPQEPRQEGDGDPKAVTCPESYGWLVDDSSATVGGTSADLCPLVLASPCGHTVCSASRSRTSGSRGEGRAGEVLKSEWLSWGVGEAQWHPHPTLNPKAPG